MSRLAIVASHVIQYQDPLFRALAAEPEIDLTVLYCSRHGDAVYRDEDMKTTLRWDLDLLQGYRHRFLLNLARNPTSGWTRLINPGIVPALISGRYDAVIFMLGWGSLSSIAGILTCSVMRTPFFLYGDSSFPPPEDSPRGKIRARLLRMLFAVTSGFMTSGVLNADYYAHYGAPRSRFFLLPWAIDNERFEKASRLVPGERDALRERYGIGGDRIAILFSAKLVHRKDPMTLLRAFERMQHRSRAAIVFMGDGGLRRNLESYVHQNRLDNVVFTGFVNQRQIPKNYAISDIFVLPSLVEPRGAVINEAMACGLPIIVTDRCGSIGDIVVENENALIFPAGDADSLAQHLDAMVADEVLRMNMGRRSREIIATWDYARGVEGVKAMLHWLEQQRGAR